MSTQKITSAKNPKIKELRQLKEKAGVRKELELFVVEGIREIEIALSAHYKLKELFICSEIAKEYTPPPFCDNIYHIAPHLYQKISYRATTEGVIAIFHSTQKELSGITLSSNPLIIVIEGVEKPGNIGAILRTAEATGADAVIICDSQTDIYNPNLIRASLGGVFRVQLSLTTSQLAYRWLRKQKIKIVTAQLQDSVPYFNSTMDLPVAIVVGAESCGLSPFWREHADERVMIPMAGELDSLNVSVSTAILCYEAIRQRRER